MRRALPFITAVLLPLVGACGGQPARQAAAARFDFGPAAEEVRTAGAGVIGLDVVAPSWLGGSAMQYRLLYADPAWRREYADSRWVAPPAELLRQALERRFVGQGNGRCRLRIELDEFVQVFDSAAASRLTVSGRAVLDAPSDPRTRRSFSLQPPAPTPDARGGVAAAAVAVAALADELEPWIARAANCRQD